MLFIWESTQWTPILPPSYLLEQHDDQACIFIPSTKNTLMLQHVELSVLKILEGRSCVDTSDLQSQLLNRYNVDCDQDYLDQSLQKLVSFGLLQQVTN